jgi:hypothetical protein
MRRRRLLPYETVDKIHLRWEHTGPRTWIRARGGGTELWQPFAPRSGGDEGARSVWKNLSGTRIRFREVHPGAPGLRAGVVQAAASWAWCAPHA